MPAFSFKQFSLYHDSSSMKIGTDAVLLGAYVKIQRETRVLEVGCGCGVISFMMAQSAQNLSDIHFSAIDIDFSSIEEAKLNLTNFPYPTNLTFTQISLQNFILHQKSETFDLIVSNPPFFVNSLKSPNSIRSNARHSEMLTFEELAQAAFFLLTQNGRMVVIIDFLSFSLFQKAMTSVGLFVYKILYIHTTSDFKPTRVILEISKRKGLPLEISKISVPSKEFSELTKDFYLGVSSN